MNYFYKIGTRIALNVARGHMAAWRSFKFILVSILLTVIVPFSASAEAGRCESIFHPSSQSEFGLGKVDVSALIDAHRVQEALWLSRQIGDSSGANQLRQGIINNLVNGRIAHVERLDSKFQSTISEVYKISFEDGSKAIFKADPMYWTTKDSANGVLANSKADFMASRFDEILGINLVPLAVKGEVQGMTGSLQSFVELNRQLEYTHEELTSSEMRMKSWELQDRPIKEADDMIKLFDYLIYNTDRHYGNAGRWLSYSKFPDKLKPGIGSGRVAFDNSASFQSWYSAEGNHIPRSPEGLKIPKDNVTKFLRSLESKLTPEVIQNEMQGHFKQNIIDEVISRRAEILSHYSQSH